MADRAKYIDIAVKNGITSIDFIKETYNSYAEGDFLENALIGPAKFLYNKVVGVINYFHPDTSPKIIPLGSNVSQLKPGDEADYILYNDFVESKNNNNVRRARDFKNTTDTLIGDKNIPLSRLPLAQGVVNGKLVVDSIKNFDDNTVITPVRSSNKGKVRKVLRPKGMYVPAVTTTNDTIYIPSTTMQLKTVFSDETGDSYFINNLRELPEKDLNELNNILAKRPKYFVLPDNGRYRHTSRNASVDSYLNPLDLGRGMFIIGKGKK